MKNQSLERLWTKFIFNHRGIIFKNNEVIENYFIAGWNNIFFIEGRNNNYRENLDFIKWGDYHNL